MMCARCGDKKEVGGGAKCGVDYCVMCAEWAADADGGWEEAVINEVYVVKVWVCRGCMDELRSEWMSKVARASSGRG